MIRRVVLLAAVIPLISGCFTVYKYGGRQYSSINDVDGAMRSDAERIAASVTPLPKSVSDRKLIVIYPGYDALMKMQGEMDSIIGVKRDAVQRADADVKIREAVHKHWLSYMLIKNRKIYRDVYNRESSSFFVAPTIYEDEDYLYTTCSVGSNGNAACESYFENTKHGRQVFRPDRSGTSHEERNQSLLNEITALAIRE